MKRNSFFLSDIALGNLRRRKRQYVLLAAGIMLAIYFAAVSLLFGYGLYTSIRERTRNLCGEQDVVFMGLDDTQWGDISDDNTQVRLGKAEVLGMAQIEEGGQSVFPIARYDSEAISITRRRLKEGGFPQEAGQLALSQSALARLRVDAGIGDTVTLILRIPDGDDFLPETVEKTYTLTGILYDQDLPLYDRSYVGSHYRDAAAGMVSAAEQIEPGGRVRITAYGILYEQSSATYQYWSSFRKTSGINMDWNIFDMSVEESNYMMVFNGVIFIIIGLVLVLACCLGIVNAFAANLDARRRQIGLLRAVGATKRQVRRIFRREMLIIALSATPVGIGLALASVYGAFALLGEDFHFVLNIWVLLGVAAAGIGCIALASGIPLRRAASVSPMQAVRDVDMIRAVKGKEVKSKTQFDVARLVAARANRIYKTRKIGIGIMLTLGVALFSVSTVAVNAIVSEVMGDYSDSYDYHLYSNPTSYDDVLVYNFHAPGLTEGDRREIAALPLVEKVTGGKRIHIKILPEEITPYATGDGWQWEYEYLATGPLSDPDTGEPMRWYEKRNKIYREGKSKYGYTGDYLNTECVAAEEDLIRLLAPYVYAGRINMDKLHSGEEVLLIAPEQYQIYYTLDEDGGGSRSMKSHGRTGERVVTTQTNDMFQAGDTIYLSLLYTDGQSQHDDEGNEIWPEDAVRMDTTAKIGALIDFSTDKNPMGFNASVDFLDVVTTISGLSAFGYDVPYRTLSATLNDMPDSPTEAYLQDFFEEIASRIPGASVTSYLEIARENRQVAVQFASAALAIIILMMAVTASMMNNTLSAHIRAGRRGIGTLRAVGVSDRIIFRSYLYQLLYLFVWGGGIGYVLSIAFALVLGHYNILGMQGTPLPYWQPILFITLLFGICLLNLRSRLRGVLRESVIDNIRVL